MTSKKDTANLSDEQLLDRLRTEDRDAFEELVSRYRDKIFRLAIGLIRSHQDAEEICQEVFMKLFQKADTFEGKASFSSWLYRIALNTTFMWLRDKRGVTIFSLTDMADQLDELVESAEEGISQPEHELSTAEALDIIEEAMEKLPYEFKTVIILRDIEGFTNEEVSEILDISVPAVKSRLHRARLFLRKKLNEYYQQSFSS